MTQRITRITHSLFLLLCLFLLSFTPVETRAHLPTAIRLRAPSFLAVARAQEQTQAMPSEAAALSSLVDEAGISAYFNRGGTINLNQVQGVYRTIEQETTQYLIGSVQVKSNTYTYPETEDAHLYVSANGWVMAYYPGSDPLSKIVDVAHFDGSSINTKLEIVLGRAATALNIGSGFTAIFYDFRYPNATHLMMIGDKTDQAVDSFQVTLPSTFTFSERGWAYWISGQGTSPTRCTFNRCKLKLNDIDVATAQQPGEGRYGTLTSGQLAGGQTHTISIRDEFQSVTNYSVGSLVLIYRETQ